MCAVFVPRESYCWELYAVLKLTYYGVPVARIRSSGIQDHAMAARIAQRRLPAGLQRTPTDHTQLSCARPVHPGMS